jgi:hypothetical protein
LVHSRKDFAMFIITAAISLALHAQKPMCVVAGHVPDLTTCLIAEYIQTVVDLAQGDADAARLGDTNTRAFYAMKARLLAERSAMARFRPYLGAADTQVVEGARFAIEGFSLLAKWDSTGQEDLRRILRLEMSAAELTEKVADVQLRSNQLPTVMFAIAGAVGDANIDRESGATRYTKRRMTAIERDSLVARLEYRFPGRLKPDAKGDWESVWAATAGFFRTSLLDNRWQYRPASRSR